MGVGQVAGKMEEVIGEWRRCRGSEGGVWGQGKVLGEWRKCWGKVLKVLKML